MKEKTILLSCAALLIFGSACYAENEQPFLGVLVDSTSLPDLLTKHLGLDPGQGLRIMNVNVGSPADKAGLERDDLIVTLQGQKVMSAEQFVKTVRNAQVGEEVSLEVIHLGQRKVLQIALEPLRKTEMKYPPEPEALGSWRPGKVFKIGPGGREWMEIPFDKLADLDFNVQKFFREVYTYSYTTDGKRYTITIEGDPANDDTQVVVQAGDAEHSTTVGKVDTLPEKYRESAKEAIDKARESSKEDIRFGGRFRLPDPPGPDVYRKYLDALPRPDADRWLEQKDRAMEKLQEQMERLQQRMKQIEEHQKEMLDRLLNKKDETRQKPEEPASSSSPETPDGSAI